MLHHAKFQIKETVCADLMIDEASVGSPIWHAEVLKETECLVEDGKAKFMDWEEAKTLLLREVAKLE